MAMEEVAVYLRTLRRGRRVSQEALAEAVAVSKRTIERFEQTQGDVGAFTFLRILAVLHPSMDHVQHLALAPSATVEDAVALATTWLAQDAHTAPTPAAPHAASRAVIAPVLDQTRRLAPEHQLELLIALGESLRAAVVPVRSEPPVVSD